MLPLVVSGAAAVDAIFAPRDRPGIEMIAPLAGHAVDDVAMAIHQDRRRLRILAIVGEKIWRFAAWGFDQPAFEIEPRERRLQLFLEIGA